MGIDRDNLILILLDNKRYKLLDRSFFMDNWKHMREFAIEIILHSFQHRLGYADIDKEIINQRITILHMDHATELLMKSFLSKENFSIYKIDRKKQNECLKLGTNFLDILSKDETLGFKQILDKICELTAFPNHKKTIILEFHKLRNEIQHRALNIPLDKDEKIEEFAPILYDLYKHMFPDYDSLSKIEGMLIEPQLDSDLE